MITKIQNRLFNLLHGNKLIYNTCWEDPRCDRMLLDIKEDSEVVMITSAGDNALDYLLDQPQAIHCVDMNYRQNALLELKKAGFQQLDHPTFFSFFGAGNHQDAKRIYTQELSPQLPDFARKYWHKHIKYFQGNGIRKSFYYRGSSGFLAYALTGYLKVQRRIYNTARQFFNASSLEEQVRFYGELENRIFNRGVKMLLNNHYTMCLAGVPKDQQLLIKQSYTGGVFEYIQDSFRKIFTQLDIADNYFYQVYFNGNYTTDCCPEYLKEDHFATLSEQVNRVNTYTSTVSQFLQDNPGQYSHFVLLDHQDWLAANDRKALAEEWELILKNSRSGTRILLRSAAKEIDFFPDFVKDRVRFDRQRTDAIHELDRVGTYASVYLGEVR